MRNVKIYKKLKTSEDNLINGIVLFEIPIDKLKSFGLTKDDISTKLFSCSDALMDKIFINSGIQIDRTILPSEIELYDEGKQIINLDISQSLVVEYKSFNKHSNDEDYNIAYLNLFEVIDYLKFFDERFYNSVENIFEKLYYDEKKDFEEFINTIIDNAETTLNELDFKNSLNQEINNIFAEYGYIDLDYFNKFGDAKYKFISDYFTEMEELTNIGFTTSTYFDLITLKL